MPWIRVWLSTSSNGKTMLLNITPGRRNATCNFYSSLRLLLYADHPFLASYSKGLINNYWSTQPYSLATFRKNAHETDSSIPKKRPATSQATKVDRKQLAQEIKSSQISTAPPSGLVWSDVEAIVNVFHSEPATVFAEVKWKNGKRNTYIPTRIIKKYCPQQVSVILANVMIISRWRPIVSSLSFTRVK